jgi:hypothetical protein
MSERATRPHASGVFNGNSRTFHIPRKLGWCGAPGR